MQQIIIDKSKFQKIIQLVALRVNAKSCNKVCKHLKKNYLFKSKLQSLKTVIDDPHANNQKSSDNKFRCSTKLILLSPIIKDIELSILPDQLRSTILSFSKPIKYDLHLDYSTHTAEQVLQTLLPKDIVVPTSFETIGHICHLNLRDEHMAYKHLIGQVILDKNTKLRTVVTKIGTISNRFRVFDMEVVAGDREFITEVKEHGCTFHLDFSKVYWNSRLSTEHQRIVKSLTPTDIVCDMFCGIGPFAIPAAKKGCLVYANDLNPASYDSLCDNVKRNKVEDLIVTFNMDARLFVHTLAKKIQDGTTKPFTHVIMNLPKIAIDFLDVFIGIYKFMDPCAFPVLPWIHVYCFSTKETKRERKSDVARRISNVLGTTIDLSRNLNIREVRLVAPGKEYMCASFILPLHVAMSATIPTAITSATITSATITTTANTKTTITGTSIPTFHSQKEKRKQYDAIQQHKRFKS